MASLFYRRGNINKLFYFPLFAVSASSQNHRKDFDGLMAFGTHDTYYWCRCVSSRIVSKSSPEKAPTPLPEIA